MHVKIVCKLLINEASASMLLKYKYLNQFETIPQKAKAIYTAEHDRYIKSNQVLILLRNMHISIEDSLSYKKSKPIKILKHSMSIL